jgi:hypothetical protein
MDRKLKGTSIILRTLEMQMDANPYLMEKMAGAYQQRRLQEAENYRLLRTIHTNQTPPPFWRPLVLALAAGLITLGHRLENAAEPEPQLACKTC